MDTRRKLFFVIIAALIFVACNFFTAPIQLPVVPSVAPLPSNQPSPLPKAVKTSTIPKPKPSLTPTAVCAGGNCANACIDKLNSFLQPGKEPGSLPHASLRHFGSLGNNMVDMVVYQIDGDTIKSPALVDNLPKALIPYQQDTVSQENIWKYFSAIIPADERKALKEFIIFTDGVGGVLASVEQSSNDPSYWALKVDIADANNPRELTYTLMHEFGHLLSLNSDQVTPNLDLMANPDNQAIYQQAAAACPQFMVSNGCSLPNSYMNLFFQNFWPKIYTQWGKVNAEKDQNNYLTLLGQFYYTYQSQFVSAYSATSPEEDFAETWARFVLGPKPTGKSIANQKVLFFYDFPELVDLRMQIANGICNYAEAK